MDKGDEENVVVREESVEKKDELVLITKFERNSGPFLLGKLAQTLKRTASKVKMHVYASDSEDCLAFNYEFTALVERRNMIGTVGDMQFTDKDFHINLDQEYEEFLERIRGVEESETEEEDLEQDDPRVRQTSSGRTLRFPDRFY